MIASLPNVKFAADVRIELLLQEITARVDAVRQLLAACDNPRMQFSIGTRSYTLIRKHHLKFDGQRVSGLCCGTQRKIWLDAGLSDAVLIDVLRHEHVHAWEWEVGEPLGVEGRADFASTVGAAFDAEFRAQGGLATILAMPIEGRPAIFKLSRQSRTAARRMRG